MTQKNKDFFDKFLYDCKEGEKEDINEFKIGYVPFTVERISDGELLHLNPNNTTYSFKDCKNGCEYSWARLFLDPRAKGQFRVLGWSKIENLESIHKSL
jgi:hypothetical protein